MEDNDDDDDNDNKHNNNNNNNNNNNSSYNDASDNDNEYDTSFDSNDNSVQSSSGKRVFDKAVKAAAPRRSGRYSDKKLKKPNKGGMKAKLGSSPSQKQMLDKKRGRWEMKIIYFLLSFFFFFFFFFSSNPFKLQRQRNRHAGREGKLHARFPPE